METERNWRQSPVNGCWVGTTPSFPDERGHFTVSYQSSVFFPFEIEFVQDNLSYSRKNVLRGLHTQQNQWQLVTIAIGEILYYVLDVNMYSKTYGKIEVHSLSPSAENQIIGRPGIAHGFLVLSDYAVLSYKSSVVYGDSPEFAINITDLIPDLSTRNLIRSKRDKSAVSFDKFFTVKEYGYFQESLKDFS